MGKATTSQACRIVCHTQEQKEAFELAKNIVLKYINPKSIKILNPEDNGKKVIAFWATEAQKKKIEKSLEKAKVPISISPPPFAPC